MITTASVTAAARPSTNWLERDRIVGWDMSTSWPAGRARVGYPVKSWAVATPVSVHGPRSIAPNSFGLYTTCTVTLTA